MEKLLIIDDDEKLCLLLNEFLKLNGYSPDYALLPEQGIQKIKTSTYQLLILDLMLPTMDGFEVCKRIRKFSDIPIIMLTARGDTSDKIIGLELGVDDYLAKPFDTRELLARIKALLRRVQKNVIQKKLKADNLILDCQKREAYLNGELLSLTTFEFELLHLLMSHAGRKFSRDQIMDAIKGVDWEAYQRGIDVAISRLRGKLGDSAKKPIFIKTVWGDGYIFILPVEEIT